MSGIIPAWKWESYEYLTYMDCWWKFILFLQEHSLKYYSFQNRIQFSSLPVVIYLFICLFIILLQLCARASRRAQVQTEKGEKRKSLKMKRQTSPFSGAPLSLCPSPPPVTPFPPPPVISSPLKQHLLQPRSLGAPSWCSVHSCVIQFQLPASHSSPSLMCEGKQAATSSSSESLMTSRECCR